MSDSRWKLLEVLAGMEIPVSRLELRDEDIRWLSRNLGFYNLNHPSFQEAMRLINQEMRAM